MRPARMVFDCLCGKLIVGPAPGVVVFQAEAHARECGLGALLARVEGRETSCSLDHAEVKASSAIFEATTRPAYEQDGARYANCLACHSTLAHPDDQVQP